jgi:hypothetical protein
MAEDEFSAGSPGYEEKSRLEQELDQIDVLEQRELDGELTKLEQEELWARRVIALQCLTRLLDLSPPPWMRPKSRELSLLTKVAVGIFETLRGFPPQAFRDGKEPLKGTRPIETLIKVNKTACYYRAIEDGHFTDKKLNKFLKDTFGASRKTIDLWSKEDPGPSYNDLLLRMEFGVRMARINGHPEDDFDRLKREEARRWVGEGLPRKRKPKASEDEVCNQSE